MISGLERSVEITELVMNRLSLEKRVRIVQALVEGNSLRSTSRLVDVSLNTVLKLLVDVGRACAEFHDEQIRNIQAKRVQCDEAWSFYYAKRNSNPRRADVRYGDIWTWVGIDADTRLIISWFCGSREAGNTQRFINDLASRINGRIQLTTDGLYSYHLAIEQAFEGQIDYAQQIKTWDDTSYDPDRRYSTRRPKHNGGVEIRKISGNPDLKHAHTNHVERQNLTLRMGIRRFTRLTNGFSKKAENHIHAVAIHMVYYNFCRIHQVIRVTPAMQAGITKDLMTIADIVKLTEEKKDELW